MVSQLSSVHPFPSNVGCKNLKFVETCNCYIRVFPDMVPQDTQGFVVWYKCWWSLTQQSLRALFMLAYGTLRLRAGVLQLYHRFPTWQQFNKSLFPIWAKTFFQSPLTPKAHFMETMKELWWKEKLSQFFFFFKRDPEASFSISVLWVDFLPLITYDCHPWTMSITIDRCG